MTYDENRISDLIEGGLIRKEEEQLRDHFAGLAMQAEISRWGDERGSIDYVNTARRAYKMAGAMLKERKENNNGQ